LTITLRRFYVFLFHALVEHNPNTWFKPADFARHLLYAATFVRLTAIRMFVWQIPLGNTTMRAENNTSDHYQDNRVQWLLGPDSRTHLRAYVAAGFVGFPSAVAPTATRSAPSPQTTTPATSSDRPAPTPRRCVTPSGLTRIIAPYQLAHGARETPDRWTSKIPPRLAQSKRL